MNITVKPLGDHDWSVEIRESQDADTTVHRLSVPQETIDALGVLDEPAFVHEAIAVFLDHQKGTALPHDVDIDWLEHHIDGFLDEVTTRLS
jgi:hypothetical protein